MVAVVLWIIVFHQNKNFSKDNSKEVTQVKESAYQISDNSLQDFDLYFLQLENEAVNKIYSPLSIKYALKMLDEGDGNTKVQIDSVVGDYKAKKYTNNDHMSFAHAMFIKEAYKNSVNKEYTTKLVDCYNAEIIYDPFVSLDNINSWVSDKTFHLINNLVDDVSSQEFILVNAHAIDMEWNQPIQATPENIEICMKLVINMRILVFIFLQLMVIIIVLSNLMIML